MMELLWLLLPVAAASGWWAARRERAEQGEPDAGLSERFKGLNYLLDDRPDQAVEALFRMVEADRDTADTHLALGNLFRRRGEVDRAISIHSKLITRASLSAQQRSRAALELGEDYLRAGLFDRAEALFRQLADQPDHTAVALARLVGIYEQERDWPQAIEYSDRLERLTGQPHSVEVAHFYCELAEQSAQRQEYETAHQWLHQALTRDPQCVRASLLRGQIALAAGDCAAALQAFQAVEWQNRRYFPEVIALLDQCYAALGRRAELITVVRQVQKQERSGRLTDALATLLVQHEGEPAALQFLEEELRHYPTLLGLRRFVELKLACGGSPNPDLDALYCLSRRMLDEDARYQCEKCGFIGRVMHWCCPSCKNWGSTAPLPDVIFKNNSLSPSSPSFASKKADAPH